MGTILVVDDQAAVRTALEVLFEVHELPVETCAGPAEALARVKKGDVDVVVQDMNFRANATSGEEGVALFRALRALDRELPIVLMTAWTSLSTAVELVKEGAADYLPKPWEDSKLVTTVKNLRALRSARRENETLRSAGTRARESLAQKHALCGLVYASDSMHQVVSLAVQIARADVPVLITGPNGAGKEKLAEIVHANSRRKDRPLIKVNVGALPDTLLEAELFGTETGAFTGAKARAGRFEAADGGTLFLDELGNLSLAGQMKLLRVLQTGEFQRLGSNVTRRCDVRLVCATNADLQAMIAQKTFREDLYFRVNVVELKIPSLAERGDDVLPLSEAMLKDLATSPELASVVAGKRLELAADARDALRTYAWPGNVRELGNKLRRAVLLAESGLISAHDLALDEAPRPKPSSTPSEAEPSSLDRLAIESALEKADWKISRAASDLGLSRQALYRRMEKLGVSLERRVRSSE